MFMLDLQKAFDTTDHDILLMKLKCMGLKDVTVNWFRSYLINRTQVCNVGDVLSEAKEISCGAPQGSILGPLLFLLYVNDMPETLKCKLLLYADDSAILVSGKDTVYIEETLSKEINLVRDWLSDNKLSLHLRKTQSILFGTKRRLLRAVKITVNCAGKEIESKTSVSYLGVSQDPFLET